MQLNERLQSSVRVISSTPEDLPYIFHFRWRSAEHLKEAIRIFLLARLQLFDIAVSALSRRDESPETEEVLLRLAGNPLSDEELLFYLSVVGDARVCELVAGHSGSPSSLLSVLAQHGNSEVRAAVSENKNCPVKTLCILCKDRNPDVRLRLAENPNLPKAIIEELSQDENPFVSARAAATLRRMQPALVVEVAFRRKSGKRLKKAR